MDLKNVFIELNHIWGISVKMCVNVNTLSVKYQPIYIDFSNSPPKFSTFQALIKIFSCCVCRGSLSKPLHSKTSIAKMWPRNQPSTNEHFITLDLSTCYILCCLFGPWINRRPKRRQRMIQNCAHFYPVIFFCVMSYKKICPVSLIRKKQRYINYWVQHLNDVKCQ